MGKSAPSFIESGVVGLELRIRGREGMTRGLVLVGG